MGLLFVGRSERWIVRPCEPPRLRRYCPGCGLARDFVCSGRFRVNAQKKTLDVWLKYRCAQCECTWKAPLLQRIPTSQLDASLREAFERDDPATVERYAFDAARWRGDVIEVVHDERILIERVGVECECGVAAHACVHLENPFSCSVRLDRLLAHELGLTRARLQRLVDERAIVVASDAKDAWRKRVRSGLCVRFNDALTCIEE